MASTISKCFAAGGISADVAEVDDEGDPFDDLDTELQDLIEQAAPSCGISTETFIRSEDELPVCYSICNEQQLLDSISNQSQEIVIEDDGESGSENEESESSSAACPQTSTLKSFAEVVASVQYSVSLYSMGKSHWQVILVVLVIKSVKLLSNEESIKARWMTILRRNKSM